MTPTQLYQSKKRSAAECVALIRPGDRIAVGIYGEEPVTFLRELSEIADQLENVEIWKGLDMEITPALVDPNMRGKVELRSYFYGKCAREAHKVGMCSLMPGNLHDCVIRRNEYRPCNVFVGVTPPMDEAGNFHLSLSVQLEMDELEHADLVILEVNPNMPLTHGDNVVSIHDVDCVIEVNTPMPLLEDIPFTETEKTIGGYVASLIKDGDCLQIGIGGTSGAVAKELMYKHDLGIHSEMITNSMCELIKKGAVNCSKKNLNPGKAIGSFAYGNQELYEFVDRNLLFEFHRCSYVNDPFIVAQNDNMVSINTTLQIDLTGQACSESLGSRQYSGTGGASDFAYGAQHSKGGRGIIAVSSTAKGGTVSRIQPILTPGSIVTISRNVVDYVVTEYGIAPLRGRTIRERVQNLIAIAHPYFRDELKYQAKDLLLW